MKSSQRLAYDTLSEALGQRGLIDSQRLNLALQSSVQGLNPFPEVLLNEGLIGDWELSRMVCEVYGLPFLPVDICTPSGDAREGLDSEFLRAHRLVPLQRYGRLLVVAMPALVPTEVLAHLATEHDLRILPVVGSVQSNNRWLQENLAAEATAPVADAADDWSSLFDEGDAAVLMDLQSEPLEPIEQDALREDPSEAA